MLHHLQLSERCRSSRTRQKGATQEPAVQSPVEHYAARSRQRATPDRIRLFDSPHFLSSRCIPGDELAAITTWASLLRRIAANEWSARDVGDGARLKIHAEIIRRHVKESGLRRECSRLLILSSFQAWTDIGDVLVLRRFLRFDNLRPAGRQIDSRRPGHRYE